MKILVIKLGADGDVIRTLPIVKSIQAKYDAEIHWLTKGDVSNLLENIPYIDRVYTIPFKSKEKFDVLYNFDIEDQALELAKEISAEKKYGFYKDSSYPAPFNPGAEYYLNTVFDDHLKKTNKKTYQEMMFSLAELPQSKERFSLFLEEEDKLFAEKYKKDNKLGRKVIGIHMGASSRWPSKVWHESELKKFISLATNKGFQVILFGGPNEAKSHPILVSELAKLGIKVLRNAPGNTKREFLSLISLCSHVVCSDSFALHVSIGLGKKTTCLFFCTSPNEVEGYGLLTKLVAPKLYDFFPEKSDQYNEPLVKSIKAEQVLDAILNQQ